MTLSLADLRTPATKAQKLDFLLTEAKALGFSTDSWQPGSVQRTILEVVAAGWAEATKAVAAIADAAYLELAAGDALDELVKSHYDDARTAAVKTQGTVKLTDSGAGPYVIAVGESVVSDVTNGYTYRNTTGGTLPASGTLDLTYEAETAGDDQNVGNGTITVLNTPLAGVTVNNPDPGTGSWITQTGADAETDAALRVRMKAKWATLSLAKPAEAYINIVTAVAGIASAAVDAANPRGAGTVDVYVAAATAAAGSGDVALAQTEVDKNRPVSADVLVIAAPTHTITVSGTVYTTDASSEALAAMKDAIKAYVHGAPLGGFDASPGDGNVIPRDGIIAAIRGASSVIVDVDLTAPTVDVLLGGYDKAIATDASLAGLAPQAIS